MLQEKIKHRLCIDVAKFERNIVNKTKDNISVYIGMPFCPTRCLYCSFASNPIESCKDVVQPYLDALSHEINEISNYIKAKEAKYRMCLFWRGYSYFCK